MISQEMIGLEGRDWIRQVQDFRKGKDEFFATSHESPPAHGKTHLLKMLRYFPPDPKYRFTRGCTSMIIRKKSR